MEDLGNMLLVLVLVLNLAALGMSQIHGIIRVVALQGVVLGMLPLMMPGHALWRALAIAVVVTLVKGVTIPRMLVRAMREVHIRREVDPLVGLAPSVVLGGVATAVAVAFAEGLPLAEAHRGSLFVPASIATVLTGFLLLATRHKAITQAVGYLVLENGVFVFGLLLMETLPFSVEMAVLLDLFAAVFIMGITLEHIGREFASLDVRELSSLRE